MNIQQKLVVIPLTVMLLVTTVTILMIERYLESHLLERNSTELTTLAKTSLESIKTLESVETEYEGYIIRAFQRLAENIAHAGDFRMTYIDANGKVLGDSDISFDQLIHIESHADRPEIALALKSGLGKMWSSTVVMTVTEFGRTLGQNGSAGTDHGYGSACMIAGGLLENAGIVSDWPGLKSNNLYEGRDLLATIDMRSVCAACLEATFGLEHDQITEDVFSDKAIKRIYNEIFT